MSKPLGIKIHVAPAGHNSSIEVEGYGELEHVTDFVLSVGVGRPSTLSVQFVNIEAEVIGEIDPASQPDWLRELRIARAVHEGLTAATGEGV